MNFAIWDEIRRVIIQYFIFWSYGEAQNLTMSNSNTSIQEENGEHLADDISKYASLNGNGILQKKNAGPCFNIR